MITYLRCKHSDIDEYIDRCKAQVLNKAQLLPFCLTVMVWQFLNLVLLPFSPCLSCEQNMPLPLS